MQIALFKKNRNGFTLLELVVVIALLAILGVAALPRMLNNYDDAHYSAVSSTAGAFSSAVMLVRTQWVATGAKGAVDAVKGFGKGDVATTEAGWASDAQRGSASSHNPIVNDVSRCVRLWDALLMTHGINVSSAKGPTTSYLALSDGSTKCIYVYQPGNSNSRIEYDLASGEVHTILK